MYHKADRGELLLMSIATIALITCGIYISPPDLLIVWSILYIIPVSFFLLYLWECREGIQELFRPTITGYWDKKVDSNKEWYQYYIESREPIKRIKKVIDNNPIKPESEKVGMTEGAIILGFSGKTHIHYVNSVPVHNGSYIEVWSDDRWIRGHYEWEKNEPIRIHHGNEILHIQEGHRVRILS